MEWEPWQDYDLADVVLLDDTAKINGNGHIVSTGGWFYFTFPTLTFEPRRHLEVEVTFSARSQSYCGFWLYSQQTPNQNGYDTSYWWFLGFNDNGSPGEAASTIVAPGEQEADQALQQAEEYVLIECPDDAIITRVRARRSVLTLFGPGICLTGDPYAPNSDAFGFTESHVIDVDTNLAVVMGLSNYSYAVAFWVVDTSGEVPVVTPRQNFNVDPEYAEWTGEGPNDPKLMAINDVNMLIPTGPRSFALVGEPEQNYDADGVPKVAMQGGIDYLHHASFFTVNADNAITRTAFNILRDDTLVDWPHPSTGGMYDGRLYLAHPTGITVADPDNDHGTAFTLPGYTSYGLMVVAGRFGYVWATGAQQPWRLVKFNLINHAVVDSVLDPGLVGYDSDVMQGCVLPDGRLVFIGTGANSDLDDYSPVKLTVFNPGTLAYAGPFTIHNAALAYPWADEWNVAVRSVVANPDGKVAVSYVIHPLGAPGGMRIAVIDPNTGEAETDQYVSDYNFRDTSGWVPHNASVACVAQDRYAAIYSIGSTRASFFGIWFAATPVGVPASRPVLLGWWDGTMIQPLDNMLKGLLS